MATISKAYEKFEKTINRSTALIRTHRTLLRTSINNRRIRAPKDLIRASVVLSVAALDAYITDVFSEKLVPYLKKYSPDDLLVNILRDAGLDTYEALNLIKMDRPYRRVRTLVNAYYKKFTTQRFEVIDKLFLAFRLKDISDRAQSKARRRTLKRSVAILIERRHKIAHDGDYNSHGRLNKIDLNETKRRIDDIKLFVKCIDCVFRRIPPPKYDGKRHLNMIHSATRFRHIPPPEYDHSATPLRAL